MTQPLISQVPIWSNYKADVVQVIREALLLLGEKSDLPKYEDSHVCHSLNRELYSCFKESCFRLSLPYHQPTREAKNQPYVGDLEPTERENKIPDFQWVFVDALADEDSCMRTFTLECKRLGEPPSRSWNLNENYVLKGICRFVTRPHEYGKGSDSCGMVGYVQSMEFVDILEEINHIACECPVDITEISLSSDGWVEDGVSELGHILERPFPISPFHLLHFWVDIRRN